MDSDTVNAELLKPSLVGHIDDQLDYLSSHQRMFISPLTDEEVEIYLKVISSILHNDKTILNSLGVSDSRALAEQFQIAWRKVQCSEDHMRTRYFSDRVEQIIVRDIPSRLATHGGFDDIFLGLTRNNKYFFSVIELKTNKIGSVALRTDKGTEASREIAEHIRKQAQRIYFQLTESGLNKKEARKISIAFYNRTRLSSNSIGLDFLRKIASSNLYKYCKNKLNPSEFSRLLESAIKQNMLISLIKHGLSFRMNRNSKFPSISKTSRRDVTDKLELTYRSTNGKSFNLVLSGKFFEIRIDPSSKEIKMPTISLNNTSNRQLPNKITEAYERINEKIRQRIEKDDLALTDGRGNLLSSYQILTKINLIQQKVYSSLTNPIIFEEFGIFENGTMKFCLETLSNKKNYGRIKTYLDNYRRTNGFDCYHYHQHWTIPFDQEFSNILGGLIEEDDFSRNYRLSLYKYLLKDSEFDIEGKDIDEIEELINLNPEISNYILQNFESPLKLPDGYFWTQSSKSKELKKALVICVKHTSKPVQVDNCSVYTCYDFLYALKDLDLNTILLQLPITFNIKEGRLMADFNCDMNSTISKVWIDFLSQKFLLSEKTSMRLQNRLGPGGGTDLLYPQSDSDLIKLLPIILLEYQNNWKLLLKYLKSEIETEQIHWETKVLTRNNPKLSIDSNNRTILDGTEVSLRLGTLDGKHWRSTRPLYCVPDEQSWFEDVIQIFKRE